MDTMPVGDPLGSWPLKKPEKVNIEKAMKQYVINRFGRAKKEELGATLLRFSDMRNMVEDAPFAKDVDERYIKAHYLYCALLTYAVQHFPFHDGSLGVSWTWADTDGKRKCQSYSPTFELSAVLCNAAALHCAVAGDLDRNRNGAVQAKQMYQTAAGLWEAARARLAAETGLTVTPDIMPAALNTLVKLSLCHALHMHYILDLLNNAPADWLSKLAYDVSQNYSAVVNQLCNPAIKDSVPKDLIHQSEMYCQLFEARAHIHLATGLHTHQKYGEEIARLEKAQELLRSAGRAAKHLSRKFASFTSKIEDRVHDTISSVEKINRNFRLSTDASQLAALTGTGKVFVRPIPLNDCFMGTLSEDPFKSLPRLANAPTISAPATSPPGENRSPMVGGDPRASVLKLIEREVEKVKKLDTSVKDQIKANQVGQPLISRVKYFQAEAQAAKENSCVGYILNTLSTAQSAIQPCRTKLTAIYRHLQSRRSSACGPLEKAADGIKKNLDKMQATCDNIRLDIQVHFAKMEKLDMTPEQLEVLLTSPQDQTELRKYSQEMEIQIRTALTTLDDLARKVRNEAGPVPVASYEETINSVSASAATSVRETMEKVSFMTNQVQNVAKEEAKQLSKALAIFEDMLNAARGLVDQASVVQEQCDILLADADRWAQEATMRPRSQSSFNDTPSTPSSNELDEKTAVYNNRPSGRTQPSGFPRTKTLSPGELDEQLSRLEEMYKQRAVNDEEYAARLRQLHQAAPGKPEDSCDTVAYKQTPRSPQVEKASNLVNSSLVDEITIDMCETVTKLTYDLKTKAWKEEPLKVYIWDKPFDEGNLRMCFMMIVIAADGSKHRYVAKRSKDEWEPDDTYKRDIETQALASMLAEAYNARKPPKKIHFLEAFLIRLDNRPANPATDSPHLMHVEPYIIGDYKKYNNNWGYVSYDERNTPQAFSHFTAEYTKERYLVVDIQGVGDMYTDPQVHSHDGTRFGIGNCGKEGFKKFFETHECNALCSFLGLKPRKKKEDDHGTKAVARIPRVQSSPRPGSSSGTLRGQLASSKSASAITRPQDAGTTRKMPVGGTTRKMGP